MSKQFARVVTAFVACGSLTHEEVVEKADVSLGTARRLCRELLEEGLVTMTKQSHAFVFHWKDAK